MEAKVRDEAARDAARLLKATFSLGVPVEPVGIANHLGVQVGEAELGEDILGALFIRPDRDPRIVLNRRDGMIRRRLTCAIEIGHYVRASATTNDYARVDHRKPSATSAESADEAYAEEFGTCLLMPEEFVVILAELGLDDLEMALRFVVSREAMQLRLERLDLSISALRAA